jgi:hypothetical protein
MEKPLYQKVVIKTKNALDYINFNICEGKFHNKSIKIWFFKMERCNNYQR